MIDEIGGFRLAYLEQMQIAGVLISAFAAGAGIFYSVGRHQGINKSAVANENLRERISELEKQVSTSSKMLEDEKQKHSSPILDEQSEHSSLSDLIKSVFRQGETDTWLTFPASISTERSDFIRERKPLVVSVANLKGGVAKTTTAINLAAYFDKYRSKRVLLIDADYQGSMSSVVMASSRTGKSTLTTSDLLVPPSFRDEPLNHPNRFGDELPRTDFVTAFYDLQNIENELLVSWLIDTALDRKPSDLRFHFSDILMQPPFNNYDVIIIDCPPRLSAATVNALTASTHILIPTIPDDSSLEAASNFIEMSRKLTSRLNPLINLLGIVPTLTGTSNLNDDEKHRLGGFQRRSSAYGSPPHIFRTNVPRAKPIADVAGKAIALLRLNNPHKQRFIDLGDEIAERLGV